jgi:P-type Cu2+ transporter
LTACFHCALPAATDAPRARLLGEERLFCCAGCEAVARTIVEGGLEAYYRTRSEPAPAPRDGALQPFNHAGSEAALMLEGVRCGACLWLIEQALRRAPGIVRAEVNYTTRRARIEWDPARTDLSALIAAIRAVGYDAAPYDPQRQEAVRERERRAALWRLFIAAFGAMQVMMYAFPAYIGGLSPEAEQLMRWASLLITLPVMLFACQPFFAGAVRELRARRVGLDAPIALGLIGGFAASAWATLAGQGEVYFDSISMLACLLLAARYAETAARSRAAAALDRLMQWVPAGVYQAGERITVAPGERIPADGVVLQGVSSADESLLTGESRPVAKRAGEALIGGSVNLEQPLVMRVTRAGDETQAAAIARLAERAAAARPRLVEAADRIAAHLTLAVLFTAAAAALAWGNAWIAVAVLVATCPCALGLAAPIVLTRANGVLLGRGALVTRSSAHEVLERVTDVVFDKTGTLTQGRPQIGRVTLLASLDAPACVDIAAALESSSRHPIARAFPASSKVAQNPRNQPGEGVEAHIDGVRYRLGSRRFCAALGPAAAPQVPGVFLASEAGWLAVFELHDSPRADAAEAVAGLRARGVEVHLASGDEPALVAALARELGINRWQGGMRPQAKHDYVTRLQDEGRVVAMVGDGLNDTPVLAAANVSFAMGGGADAAQLRADIVLPGNRLATIAESLSVAQRVMRLVRQNFAWALAYNAFALPAAALGWIGPWEAALGMGVSSIIVMLNASRALAPQEPWKASTSSSRSPSLSYS